MPVDNASRADAITAEMRLVDQPFAIDGYVLTDLLGFGTTGEVWRGRDETTREPVAVKRLWEPGAEGLVLRLRQDAAVVAEVAGPHAVPVLEVDTLASGETVLVMDLAEGGSLASLITRRGRLHPSEVVTILAPLAQALAGLHGRGMVHGDLTPSNVLLAADGRPMLADVGLAIATGERPGDDLGFRDPVLDPIADPAREPAGGPSPIATPPTPAADCFALAAIGYAALTGVPPRSASSPDVVEAIVGRAPWVPPALAAAIEAALAPDPAMRPDAAGFGAAVLASCTAGPVRLTGPRRTTEADPAPNDAPPPRRRSRRLIVAGVVAGVLGISALAGIGSARLNPPSAAALQPAPSTPPRGIDALEKAEADRGDDYRPIVARLFARRAKAFATARLALLKSVYAPDSFVLDMDTAALRNLRSGHLRARGLRQRVVSLRVDDASTAGRSVELWVTATIPAYVVVKRSGRVVAHRPGRTQTFEMELQRSHGRWLISNLAATRTPYRICDSACESSG